MRLSNERRIGSKTKRVNHGHDVAQTVEIDDPKTSFAGKPIKQRVERVVTQTMLDRFKHRRLIEDVEYRAGDDLRALIYVSGLEPKVTVNFDATGGGAGRWAPYAEGQTGARLKLRDAQRAIGRELWPLLYNVCCDAESPASFMMRHGEINAKYAQTKGMDRLRVALRMLSHHFGP